MQSCVWYVPSLLYHCFSTFHSRLKSYISFIFLVEPLPLVEFVPTPLTPCFNGRKDSVLYLLFFLLYLILLSALLFHFFSFSSFLFFFFLYIYLISRRPSFRTANKHPVDYTYEEVAKDAELEEEGIHFNFYLIFIDFYLLLFSFTLFYFSFTFFFFHLLDSVFCLFLFI